MAKGYAPLGGAVVWPVVALVRLVGMRRIGLPMAFGPP